MATKEMTPKDRTVMIQAMGWIYAFTDDLRAMGASIQEEDCIDIDVLTTMIFRKLGYSDDEMLYLFTCWEPTQKIQTFIKLMYDQPVRFSY